MLQIERRIGGDIRLSKARQAMRSFGKAVRGIKEETENECRKADKVPYNRLKEQVTEMQHRE